VAPFSGNIIELCPVGALTSQPYRFRARPWDIEGAGGICTLCPAQCNVEFTVRDEKVLRVLARDSGGHPGVDDGWLCDKGRFAYQAIHVDERIVRPLVRDGGELRPVSWERALDVAAGLAKHKGRVGTLVGGQTSNEEGFLLGRLSREALESNDIDSRTGEQVPLDLTRALADPKLQATVPDLEFAHTVLVVGCEPLDDAPIFDLRIRKGVRRRGVQLAIATARPSALDPNARTVVRFPPGSEASFLGDLAADLAGSASGKLAQLLKNGGEDVVIVWGERIGGEAAAHLLRIAELLGLAGREGAGLLEIPSGANGRGLREVGALPNAGPGYATLDSGGRGTQEIARAIADGEVTALHLFGVDPVRDLPDRALWEAAMHHAGVVVAHASVLTEGLAEHANVIFPAESYAEKEGTVVHPDGRVQRLRTAIAHPGEIRAGWSVVAAIAGRAGVDLGVLTAGMAFRQLVEAVPFYARLTLERIGGRGVRWPAERDWSELFAGADELARPVAQPGEPTPSSALGLRLGTYRPIWASREVEISPALQYTIARQQLELSPEDARRLQVKHGDTVSVSQLDGTGAAQSGEAGRRAGGRPVGTRLKATAHVRTGVPVGAAFLAEGIAKDSANALTEREIEVTSGIEVTK
jgi:NADH-quinone oxidoreductase subunit G